MTYQEVPPDGNEKASEAGKVVGEAAGNTQQIGAVSERNDPADGANRQARAS